MIAYCLSNISAKNYQNQLMCFEVIVCNTSVVFLRHRVYIKLNNNMNRQKVKISLETITIVKYCNET